MDRYTRHEYPYIRFRPWLAVGLLSACADHSTSPPPNVATLSVNGSTLELSVTASASALRPGAYDTIAVTLANTGPSSVRLDFPSGCQILLYVRDFAGQVVFPDGGSWVCTAALTRLSRDAGQSVVNQWV